VDGSLSEAFGPAKGWFWDLSLNYGRNQGDNVKTGNLYRTGLAAALGPSMLINNVPRCVSKANDPTTVISGCVPLDLFHGPGTIGQDQVAPLTFTGTARGYNQLTAFQFNTSGELFTLYAERPVGLALGYEYRNLLGAYIPDPFTANGLTTGNKGFPTRGGYHVNEGYAELSVPIIANVKGAEIVEAIAAARVFSYSNFGSDWTYKFGGRYSPIRDVTVRGTYSTAFRAPSIADLFFGQSDSFPNVSDPCAGSPTAIDPNSALGKACGAAVNNLDTAKQLRSQIGGNPDLMPETAKIFTAGVVLEPTMIRNFTITVDYYNLKIDQPITAIGVSNILNGCYLNGNGAFCNYITRDVNSQRIINVSNLQHNAGKESTDGVDFALRYVTPSPVGRFGFIFDGTWLRRRDRTLADGTFIPGKGTFDLNSQGSYGTNPAFKFNSGVTWALMNLGAGVSMRYIGPFKECGDSSGLMAGTGACYIDQTYVRTVHPYATYDLYVSYNLKTDVGKTAFAVGVNNLFDTAPPVIYNGFNTSDPSAYDFGGRRVYGRIAHTF
jgi:outer membrane receptor protein involved in Fe transport